MLEKRFVHPAARYNPAKDLWILTCYFNPNKYTSRLANYFTFRENILASGVPMLTVECTFGDRSFELDNCDNVLQLKSKDILWQKERLLNIAMEALPKSAKKIAWLDCDILFDNPNWMVDTSILLDEFPVVQPYENLIFLPQGQSWYENERQILGNSEYAKTTQSKPLFSNILSSFGYVRATRPELSFCDTYSLHGHTGVAWAIRTDIIRKFGFYDTCISGVADHLMAHAMCGDFYSSCITKYLGDSGNLLADFIRWAQPCYEEVKGNIAYTPGNILHLWHGDKKHRKYGYKSDQLRAFDFDSSKDLKLNDSNCWEWNSHKPELHKWAISFFESRKEDGDEQ